LLDNGPAAVSFGGTAASSAGQDVVNAKFDIGFRPTARKYERVQLLISTDDRAGHRFGWSLQPGPPLVPASSSAANRQ
jgi:hypothetical protein